MEFKVEDNIPPPTSTSRGVKKYPFGSMLIGQSFSVPKDKFRLAQVAAHVHGHNHGKKFRTFFDGKKGRIWRIA